MREALSRADLVITTGGLGPTSDDLTRELIAELLGRKLRRKPDVLAHIENFFARRDRPRPQRTDVETLVPEGALVFLEPNGHRTGAGDGEDGSREKAEIPICHPPSASANGS